MKNQRYYVRPDFLTIYLPGNLVNKCQMSIKSYHCIACGEMDSIVL